MDRITHTQKIGHSQGCALVQSEGQDILTAGPGDIVQIPPDVRHWHGAASDQSMAHVAILESLDGVGTTWMDLVSDDQIPPDAGC